MLPIHEERRVLTIDFEFATDDPDREEVATVDIDLLEGRVPGVVMLETNAGPGFVAGTPELFERVAAALTELRARSGDSRGCCAAHGYYDHTKGCGECQNVARRTS